MKKRLIALAVAAASGAAMAQSTVTVYGRLDGAVGTIKKLGGSSDNKMFSGGDVGLTTPRLGFRGTEDLGGGLKANFKLEQRINIDTGETQAPSFKGETTVGLSGGFGSVRVGRMLTVYDDVRGLSNSRSLWDSNTFTPNSAVFKTSSSTKTKNADYASRANSQIRYDLPEMGGVYGGLTYAFEQTAGAKDTITGLNLGYKTGGLNAALGYQNEKTKNKYTILAASYDFGAFAISGGYNTRKGAVAADGKDTEYGIGFEVPLGAVSLSLGFASGETKNVAKASKSSGFGIGARYALSKRTSLYGGYSAVQEKTQGVKSADTKVFALGLRHDF
ncbi:MAG: porin [Hydrogenophaga sp.]|nr:porin [Hydrogenophaga sp.]